MANSPRSNSGTHTAHASAALAESLPLTRSGRRWNFLDVSCVNSGLAIATWAFLYGGTTAQLVGFWDGVFAIFVGSAIGVVFLLLGVLLPSAKWGTEFYTHQRAVYGPLGVLLFFLLATAVFVVITSAQLSSMAGKAVTEIVRSSFPTLPAGSEAITNVVTVLMLLATWRLVVRGSSGVRWINLLATPLLFGLCIWLMVCILGKVSFADIVAAPPVKPGPDRAKNFMLAVELNAAGAVGWFQLAANLGRFAKTQRAAVWGSVFGYVVANGLACTVGLTSALVLGSADPVTWMVPIVGVFSGVLLLLILILANLTTLVGLIQACGQSYVQILGPRVQSLGWSKLTGLLLLCAAIIGVLATDALFENFFSIVALSTALLAPACGIALADHIFLRKRQVNLRALYEQHHGSPYHFWKRINPCALGALAAGCVTYLWMLDPISFAAAPAFKYLSATVPSIVVGFAVHLLLTRFIAMPLGWGAYARSSR